MRTIALLALVLVSVSGRAEQDYYERDRQQYYQNMMLLEQWSIKDELRKLRSEVSNPRVIYVPEQIHRETTIPLEQLEHDAKPEKLDE